MKQEVIKLTQKQINKLDIINKAIAGIITVSEASVSLGISERQVKRLKKKVRIEGAAAIVHKNSMNSPINKTPQEAGVLNHIEGVSGVPSKEYCFKWMPRHISWFKGDKKFYSLHGAIDDAAGQITGLYMCKNECMYGKQIQSSIRLINQGK